MDFVFNERKAAQAAARLLDRHDGRMPYLKLIKLLYLADRQSLVESGTPITGDRFVSMDRGPVLSKVLDLIRADPRTGASAWHEYVSPPVNFEVSLLRPAEGDELSEYERDLLDRVVEEYGHMSRWDLVEHTHDLPEWVDPAGSAIDIDVTVILRGAGFTAEEIRAVREQADAAYSFHEAYSG